MKHDLSVIRRALENNLIKDQLKIHSLSSRSLFHLFERALEKKFEPFINVVPSEPGSGKSRGIQEFLRAYRDRGFSPAGSSIVVFLSRREEIKDYITGAGLMGNEYAALDSQSPRARVAEYGGDIDPSCAPILFTTAQLAMSRCAGSFDAFDDLFYKGKPRPLRIWDEGFRIAEAVTVSADELGLWTPGVRILFPALAALMDDLGARLRATVIGDAITVPNALAGLAAAAFTSGVLPTDPKKPTDVRDRLMALSGKVARVSKVWAGVKALVAEDKRLPVDIAPLFVLDASARVDGAYEVMKASGIPIIERPGSTACYSPATFHHLKMGAGRSKLRKSADRQSVILEAAAVMNADPDEPWIVVYPNLKTANLADEIRRACVNPIRLEFVKWGDHRASNDHREIRKVMSIGLLRYSDAGYDEAHVKAGGAMSARSMESQKVRDSELRSAMLQAFARSNMRNHAAPLCGDCQIYVVDNEKALPRYLKETFPGCVISEWKPSVPKLTKQQRAIVAHLNTKSGKELETGVTKSSVYTALGIDKSNFAKLLKGSDFIKVLSDADILIAVRKFYREPVS